jgi:hypothetical protein
MQSLSVNKKRAVTVHFYSVSHESLEALRTPIAVDFSLVSTQQLLLKHSERFIFYLFVD